MDGEGCWNCVMPSESPDSCQTFCTDIVEPCRINTCSSGSACKTHYYSLLNCVLVDMEGTAGCTYNRAPDTNVPASESSR